ncbi:putative serine carboxypeptidase (CpdS) [Aspergillus clavatus NRRL 1]|uniref:Carboxypeptidase n=1 Tax=Aspergillus clavatus (strain ATCC 1007 / CBS 513.65 / DSM 816 / NCTC 3887 / NRRL 1 / QM 1276 / 107) TaxID=344612 RepID=A1CN56_ASPCL|nr:serine carboxypeptidase (CpdS), putative [Aspergillus clavatus NRRL 1]EAW08993.1 serine carboxypeptidase (CpdS), putative [Aspergillus clavatus NRRL 1]
MRVSVTAVALLLAGAATALDSPHRKGVRYPQKNNHRLSSRAVTVADHGNYRYLTSQTKRFLVNGTAIPEVDFDVGESYAGLLPNTPAGNSSLFFWFFPSTNPKAQDEITIWLNGGPGCSSLDGLLQENGPFLWQSGTYKPIRNPYSWTNLTNVLYVDQPAGTGFSPGPPTVNNEEDVANQFKSWFKHFVDTFNVHNRKVYITGESYAGQYIPYIASAMLDTKDHQYFNVKGIQINDPSINDDSVMTYAPAVRHLNQYLNIFSLNDTFVKDVNERAEACGYNKFMDAALTFPPPKNFPVPPDPSKNNCALWDEIIQAAYYVNPCFNFYHITDFCPYLWDEMGFPSLAGGPNNYFNRSDVQKVLNVPPTDYAVCGDTTIFPKGDQSLPSALGPLPGVIERTNNVLIGHGWLDYLLFANGSLATIQNMTWNGAQGFQHAPVEPLFVPYHYGLAELWSSTAPNPFILDAGAGYMGTAHTERGLTFSTVNLAGHEIPQYTPGAAYRHLEFLLGRIDNLSALGNYTA